MKAKNLLIAVIAVLVIGGMWLINTYNGLVRQNQAVEESWAQVESQYQRRFDLIPNLVEAAKGFMKQEKDIFDNLAKARQGYAGANTVSEKAEAAGQVESALGRLLVIMENYPELKSNETVQSLMDELAGTENRISVERKRYNEQVKGFNTSIKTFPTVMMARILGFEEKAYFEAVEAAATAPKVNLTD
jgi:LemA protein